MTHKQKILHLLAPCEYPHTAGEVARTLGINRRVVQARMTDLARAGRLLRCREGYRVA